MLPRMRFLALCIAARLILGVEDHAQVIALERRLVRALSPYSMLAGIDALRIIGPASPQAVAERCRRAFARGLADVLRPASDSSGDGSSSALELFGANELFALLLAGHETTATAVAWTIDHLARAAEVATALADEPADAGRPWLDAVIHDAAVTPAARRHRPPVTGTSRAGRTRAPTGDAAADPSSSDPPLRCRGRSRPV